MSDHAGFRIELGTLRRKALVRARRSSACRRRPYVIIVGIVGCGKSHLVGNLLAEYLRSYSGDHFIRMKTMNMDDPARAPHRGPGGAGEHGVSHLHLGPDRARMDRLALADIDVGVALRSYLSFHLKEVRGDYDHDDHDIRGRWTELVSELRHACSTPAPAMEPFVNRVVAHHTNHGGWLTLRDARHGHRELLADRIFVRSCFAFPDEERREVGSDLSRLGGFVRAAFRASRHVAAGAAAWGLAKALSSEAEEGAWSVWLARTCEVTVRTHPSRDLPACFVKTPAQRVIWLSQDLPDESRPIAILHELSHWLLDHRPNTEYGLNPDRLSDFGRAEFQRQEREADAYARLLLTALESLKEVVSARAAHAEDAQEPPRRYAAHRSAA